MHKLTTGSSTTLQISATLQKLHASHRSYATCVCYVCTCIFDVGETSGSSYQQLTVCGANHIYT